MYICKIELTIIMNKSNHNLTKKAKGIILSVVVIISLSLLGLALWACHYYMKSEARMRYTGIMNVASEKIAKSVSGMEMNAMNVFDEVEKHMDTPETVIGALQSKTYLNPDVKGYFAAFELDYFPQRGKWFEPYVHRTDTSSKFEVTQLGSARHNYTKSDWYIKAKELKMSFWSDPYYFYDGTSVSGHYCTFVNPIYNAEGELVCVCGAGMTFEWLAKELKQIDLSSQQDELLSKYMFKDQDFYTVVLNGDGSCLAQPEGQKVVIDDENMLMDLKMRKSGVKEMTINGENATVYYGPIRNINWMAAVVVPAHEVLKPLLVVGAILLAVMLLGIITILKTKRFIPQTMAATVLVMLALTFLICRYAMKAETHARYVGIMNVAAEKVVKSIRGMEMNAMNVFDEVEKHMDSPEAVIGALKSKTSLNPDIKGYFAAFEQDYFPQKKGWFQPYVYRAEGSDEYVLTQIGSGSEDYTNTHLYKLAKEQETGFWSEPYDHQEESGKKVHYCSFMMPLYDETGKLACICGADMTLEWLKKELIQIDHSSKQNSLLNNHLTEKDQIYYTVMLNDDGSCLVNPEGGSITIEDKDVIKDLQQHKSGTLEMTVDGVPATIYYGPVKDTDWSVAVVVPNP